MSKTKIFGFAIRNRKNNYYGVRRFGDRVYWVALGNSLVDVENKIRAYCQSKGLDLVKKPRVTKKYLTEKVSELEKMVIALTERVRQLEESNTAKLDVRQAQTNEVRPFDATPQPSNNTAEVLGIHKISGFTVRKNKQGYYVANRGKVNIYLGSSLDKAQEKIAKYLSKHPEKKK